MGFWQDLDKVDLQDFRPGIRSKAELGEMLIMAVLEIGPGKEDPGHEHPFEQCGIVIEGKIEVRISDERRLLKPRDAYFIPAGVVHGWKSFDLPAKILDISAKPK